MAKVKICGLKTVEDYKVCADIGAAFAGLVFHPRSPRHLSDETAANIASARHQNGPQIVALCVEPNDRMLDQIIEACRPDWLQLHGHETPERCDQIRQTYGLHILKAISVHGENDIIAANAYSEVADMLLFDAATGNPDMPGGTGTQFDWSLLASHHISAPWMLAGGLNPKNVANAIAQTGAKFVDVSSGVESEPGIKDHKTIKHFVSAAELG